MKDRFSIEVDWERLESGSPEDRATYGAIGIRLGNVWLTDAHDVFARRVRSKVYLSGYQLAQWFAWNWWRLRWEPKRQTVEWKMAHRFATIGDRVLAQLDEPLIPIMRSLFLPAEAPACLRC